jgi:hypothetical protein
MYFVSQTVFHRTWVEQFITFLMLSYRIALELYGRNWENVEDYDMNGITIDE